MNTKKCPSCGKDLPEELNFCPYCMEKLVAENTLTPLKRKKQEISKKTLIIIISAVLLLAACAAAVLMIKYFKSDKPIVGDEKQTGTDSVAVGTVANTGNSTNRDETSNTKPSHDNNENSSGTSAEQPPPDTTEAKPEKISVSPEKMTSNWNAANQKLSLWNYTLSNYTVSEETGESAVISQHFNNCGADVKFYYEKDLSLFILGIENAESFNTVCDLCALSLASFTGDYSDDFRIFLSEGNWRVKEGSWEGIGCTTEYIEGDYSGYHCTVTLITAEDTDERGNTFTRYTCSLTAEKI